MRLIDGNREGWCARLPATESEVREAAERRVRELERKSARIPRRARTQVSGDVNNHDPQAWTVPLS